MTDSPKKQGNIKPRTRAQAMRLEVYEEMIGITLAGRYKLEELIGVGGMGAVFRATQTTMNRTVAIKILPNIDVVIAERFKREAYTASKLSSNHTITLYDFGVEEDEDLLYLTMEFLEGHNLRTRLDEGPLPPGYAAHIVSQICRSLAEAHKHGIIHRDIKPANIFITKKDDDLDLVKVLDFGIAKIVDEADEDGVQLTQEGRLVGTPQYISPEQVRGEGVDHRTDLYGLGVVLFEMVTGVLPFTDKTSGLLLLSHANAPPPVPSSVAVTPETAEAISPELDAFILKALAKKPDARFPDADTFRRELLQIVDKLYTDDGTLLPASARSDTYEVQRPPGASLSLDAMQPIGPMSNDLPLAEIQEPDPALARAPEPQEDAQHATSGPEVRSTGMIVVLIAVVLVIIIIAAYLSGFGSGESPKPEREITPVEDPVRKHTITIASTPAGASIYSGDLKVGVTPTTLPLMGDEPVTYRVELEGFAPMERTFDVATLPSEAVSWEPALTALANSDAGSPDALDAGSADADTNADAEADSDPASDAGALADIGTDAPTRAARPNNRARGQRRGPKNVRVKKDCDPPFTIDTKGVKRFKPHCLR